jgi:hypothetical protein
LLGSFHLTLMAALGIWFWSEPGSFGKSNPCAIELASTTILGSRIPLKSERLRAASLVVYSVFLIPGLNLVIPMCVFLGLYITYQKRYRSHPYQSGDAWNKSSQSVSSEESDSSSKISQHKSTNDAAARSPHGSGHTLPMIDHALHSYKRHLAWYHRLFKSVQNILPVLVSMATLFIINLIFIVDIELALKRNESFINTGEADWTFGQILAILLLVLPLRDLLDTILERREKQQEKRRKKEHTISLQNSIRLKKVDGIRDLVRIGADVNTKVEGIDLILNVTRAYTENVGLDAKFATALQLASYRNRLDLVAMMLRRGADPNIQGEYYLIW